MEKPAMSTKDVVEEIARIQKSLPARPELVEVETCNSVITNVEKEAQLTIEAISRQIKGEEVPDELFEILQDMKRGVVSYQSNEEKREALKIRDLENIHCAFDEMVMRAARFLSQQSSSSDFISDAGPSSYSRDLDASLITSAFSSGTSLNSGVPTVSKTTTPGVCREKDTVKSSEFVSKDDSLLKKSRRSRSDGAGVSSLSGDGLMKHEIQDLPLKPDIPAGEKLNLMKLASWIEVSSKEGTKELSLQAKLSDQIKWIPHSIGKLSNSVMLDLSENHIVVLPETIRDLSALQKLDINSNRIIQLPGAIGDLLNLVSLNVSGNELISIPSTLARLVRLEELNLSSNSLLVLPYAIGSLVSLKILNVEHNDIEEIPHSIGQCTSLMELWAGYNKLKALPEAVGRMGSLEVVSVRYNTIRQLPTTMGFMVNLKELNISFNELEAVPDCLCVATKLVKLNVSNNFANLRSLPRAFGNLEELEELDISYNQIKDLPETFGMLQKLHTLNLEENPLLEPPSSVIQMGAQAVVKYMGKKTAQPDKQKKSFSSMNPFSKYNKRKRGG